MRKELVVKRDLKFGVEMEVSTGGHVRTVQGEISRRIKALGVAIKVEGYNHNVTSAWKITTDGSVSGGIEIVSPVLRDMEDLEKVCAVLTELENEGLIAVNRDCGLHVHHDINDYDTSDVKKVFRLYDKYEEAIDKFMPHSRRGNDNRWCSSVRSGRNGRMADKMENAETMQDIFNEFGIYGYRSNARYVKLNICSYIQHGTLEFRHHSGTVDFEKIKNWVLITHKMVEVCKEKKVVKKTTEKRLAKWNESDVHMFYDFYQELELSATEVADYIKSRKKQLA